MCYGGCLECSFSVSANAQNGALGETSFYPRITQIVGDEKTAISFRAKQVRTHGCCSNVREYLVFLFRQFRARMLHGYLTMKCDSVREKVRKDIALAH